MKESIISIKAVNSQNNTEVTIVKLED